ncbi:peptidoglycan-binding protein [Salipaludibacillus sp. CF4.18]|uniref:peptidoglycan-binding protein n=1 Tax=Salipaludibacillus sp. CF4.18 TaxID=3373081 RepID=UPI003EE65C07
MSKILDVRSQMPGGTSKRNVSKVNKIARHHSATIIGDAFSFADYHVNHHRWLTSGYHEVILLDGTVQRCYSDNVITNGILNHNSTTFHICVVGNGSFTDAQEKAFEERAKAAMIRFNLSVKDVLGHNEFSGTSTSCPGINMSQVRSRLSGNKPTEALTGTVSNSKAPSTVKTKEVTGIIAGVQSTVNSRYGLKIAVDNIYGDETKGALVRGLQTELNKQTNAKLIVDGIFGPNTRKACINVRQGAKGNITWILQAILHCSGFKLGKIDGVFGTRTRNAVRNFQSTKNLAKDGIAGPQTFQMLFK